ncbi:excalibur calcium-binding domain-containing protein [Paenibacillus xylaniclasticus]|uniref:excalibur calcium-binding domain-containing protein n=1 Tax=Paenibacillus xylaniclasticus TaxID=588083 RepID=UPI001FE9411A|nr:MULTISPECIES: excalibur calcium-binding domain-containing protein [Paenibacillus]
MSEQPANNEANRAPAGGASAASDVEYRSCTDVRQAGVAPLHKGDAGYSLKLDRDGDGIACE